MSLPLLSSSSSQSPLQLYLNGFDISRCRCRRRRSRFANMSSYFTFMSFHSQYAIKFTGRTLSHCFSLSSCLLCTDTITDYCIHGVSGDSPLHSPRRTNVFLCRCGNDESCGFYGLNFVLYFLRTCMCSLLLAWILPHIK